MTATNLLARLLSCAVLLFAFGLAVYRAKVLTITHDEALTYEWFLDQGVSHVLNYNPANHVLQTLLAKPIVKIFGVSEFNLRLPSLIGAAIYFVATFFLCRTLFCDGAGLLFSVTMLSLNPLIMDYMAAARGYGLGLAGLSVAMYILARLVERGKFDREDKEWRWGCGIASVSLALSVAAHLTNIVPAVCLAIVFSLVAMGGFSAPYKIGKSEVRSFAQYFILPGTAVAFCILWPFLIQWRLAPANTPLDKASDAMRDVFNASLLYKWTDDVINDLGAVPSTAGTWQARMTDLGEFIILPLLLCLVLIGLVLAFRNQSDTRKSQNARCQIFAGAAVMSVVLIFILHITTKVNYPYSRYCLFLIPLFTIGAMLAAREISARFPWSLLKGVGLLIALMIVSDYVLSLNTKFFRASAYDVISRELYRAIERDAHSRGLTNVRVGGTWWYEPEINFYRRRFNAEWMKPYDVKDRSYFWESPDSLAPGDYDYFVFVPPSDPGLTGTLVKTIFHNDRTRVTIIALTKP
jgi:4-amino-4-deoxy-L-arabinose transferase-like glycosyltransferase